MWCTQVLPCEESVLHAVCLVKLCVADLSNSEIKGDSVSCGTQNNNLSCFMFKPVFQTDTSNLYDSMMTYAGQIYDFDSKILDVLGYCRLWNYPGCLDIQCLKFSYTKSLL
jgi:hypothetical protein